jgi:hypothetical protein
MSKAKKPAKAPVAGRLKARLVIHPCMGVSGHYRSDAHRPVCTQSGYKIIPFPWARPMGRVCYWWELIVHDKPRIDYSLSGFSLKSNWNYMSVVKCMRVAREAARLVDLEIVQEILPKPWSKGDLTADLKEEKEINEQAGLLARQRMSHIQQL